MQYFEEADIAVTICNREGVIVAMNRQSREVNLRSEEETLVGENVLDCHPEPAQSMLKKIMAEELKHVYTIEKNGKKKLIYQIPWYENSEYAGFIELSMIIPFEMEHKIRLPKTVADDTPPKPS